MKRIVFYTLGCRSNQYETDKMAEEARTKGYEIVPYPQTADIYVINTCAVTSLAARKSRNIARHARRINPNAKVIFAGCDAEIESISEADLTLSNSDKLKLAEHLERLDHSNSSDPGFSRLDIRSNLMIEDGCENFCTYCIVPHVRGKVRSRPMDEIVAEAENMVKNGVREIVLTGINLGEFKALPSLFPSYRRSRTFSVFDLARSSRNM